MNTIISLNSSSSRKSRKASPRRIGKWLPALVLTLSVAPVFAGSQGPAADPQLPGNEAVATAQPAGTYGADRQSKEIVATPGTPGPAKTERVYLDDYEYVPQAVTKKRSTKMVWLGQKNKSG